MKIRPGIALLSLPLLLAVVSCNTAKVPVVGTAIDSLSGRSAATEARLSTAAENAVVEGKTEEALVLYEKLYTHNTTGFFVADNPDRQNIALNYAQLLRKSGKAQRAITVLSSYVEGRDGNVKDGVAPIILNEYAASSIELGNFDKAETVLNTVLEDKNASKFHADAYNLLGIVLDAQSQHREAEQAFRQALETWKGDKTSVMNNLALCLASQGMFDESLTTLRQALVMAKDKQGIARNIQMISDLKKSVVPTAPVALKSSQK
mgnify:CR=1 FL=1